MEIFLIYLFFLGPNLIWTLCMFCILKSKKIKLERKILYLLFCNVIFMFLDVPATGELFNETVMDISSAIITVLQICLCVYWARKNNITSLFNEKKNE